MLRNKVKKQHNLPDCWSNFKINY